MVEINKIKRLNEFSAFLEHVKADDGSNNGRKFVFKKEGIQKTYTMNELSYCYEKCVKKSIQNHELVNKVTEKMNELNFAATEWVKENNTCLLFLRQFFGNLWFAITHCGFNKDKALTDIADYNTRGREDLTLDKIKVQDSDGNTVLHRLIKENKNPRKLGRDIKELIDNGADPDLKNKRGQTFCDLCLMMAFETKNFASLNVLFKVAPELVVGAISRCYKCSLAEKNKVELAKMVKFNLKSPVAVLHAFQDGTARKDFLMIFLQHGKPAFDPVVDATLADKSGNNMLHYGALYLTELDDIKNCVSCLDKLDNWKEKNKDGKLPVDLVEDPKIIAYLNSL